MINFAKRIKELRTEKGLTQTDVANFLNIKQQSYARYENDTAEPSLEMVVKLAAFFNVTCDYLLGVSDI